MGLTLFGLLSISILYGGIDRLKRTKTPPFAGEGHLYSTVTFLPRPSNELLLRLDRMPWRIALWTFVIAAPLLTAFLFFKSERPISAILLLGGWSCVAGTLGFWIWLYSMFHALSG